MLTRRQFVFQENFFTGANLVLGNLKMNLQSDEIVNVSMGWEEMAPILRFEKIQRPEDFI